MRVELNRKSLFALASDTRVEILHSLQPMRRTVTQLAEALAIDKAAIHRHLKKLEEGGLVKREEDHGFVYYGLSWKARDLLAPGENTRIIITLGVVALLLALAVFLALGPIPVPGGSSPTGVGPTAQPGANPSSPSPSGSGSAPGGGPMAILAFLPSLGLGVTAGILLAAVVRRARRPRQPLPRVED